MGEIRVAHSREDLYGIWGREWKLQPVKWVKIKDMKIK